MKKKDYRPVAVRMKVVIVDKDGKRVGDAKWVITPDPDGIATDGFAHIEYYVTQLISSSASFTSLIIGTPDKKIAVLLWQRDGVSELNLSVDWLAHAEVEKAIRQFFNERKLVTSQDYLAGNGGVPDATRILSFELPIDAPFITSLTKDVLHQIYKVDEHDALDFGFEQHDATDKP